jgi:hypothetical protein
MILVSRTRAAKDDGMAYIVILFLMVIMLTLGMAFMLQVGADLESSMAQRDTLELEYLAESAVAHAKWRLLNEPGFPASQTKYYMHSLGAGRYGYKVRPHTATTFATIATVAAMGDNVVTQSYVAYIKPPADPEDAWDLLTVYDTAVNNPDTKPNYRTWHDAVWGSEYKSVSVGNKVANWIELEGSVSRTELVMGAGTLSDDVYLSVFDGTDWASTLQLATSSDSTHKGFDIAYESVSGDAIVVTSEGADTSLRHAVWDGSSWSVPVDTPVISAGQAEWVVMEADPKSDEIMIGVYTDTPQIELFCWDGTTMNNLGVIEAAPPAATSKGLEIAYERTTGHALIVYGEAGSDNLKYRIWDGVTLGPELNGPLIKGDPGWILASSDPTSEYIFVGCARPSANQLVCSVWDGNNWITINILTSALAQPGGASFDVAWESSGNAVLMAWADAGYTNIRYAEWTKGTLLTSVVPADGPKGTGSPVIVALEPVRGSDRIALMLSDDFDDIYGSTWSGTAFIDDPAIALATDVSSQTALPIDLASTQSASGVPSLEWTFDNEGAGDYKLTAVSSTEIYSGVLPALDPTITLKLGRRYKVDVSDSAAHPIQIIAKGATAGGDIVLLSQYPSDPGSFDGDPEVNWAYTSEYVLFTMTQSLLDAMNVPAKGPGYRCALHVSTMRGDFTVN